MTSEKPLIFPREGPATRWRRIENKHPHRPTQESLEGARNREATRNFVEFFNICDEEHHNVFSAIREDMQEALTARDQERLSELMVRFATVFQDEENIDVARIYAQMVGTPALSWEALDDLFKFIGCKGEDEAERDTSE